ncbi:MAG: ORF6N domain-containing protein [Gallionella sp.]|nr:ORF6N domain-containing protein [Gallionella sp.]
MTTEKIIASVTQIESRMFFLRKQKVMLSQHLAELYEVEPKILNQAVKRNLERFPEDFMFQLTPEEDALLRSQFVTLKTGRGQHAKYLPYAFTEQGVAMLSSVLRSERAIQGRHSGEGRNPVQKNTPRSGQNLGAVPLAWNISTIWIPAFAGMTKFRSNGLFGFEAVFEAIHELMAPPVSKKKRPIGFASWENK